MKRPGRMFKVFMFNEWKESPTYKIDKWFIDRKIQIEKWFETELPDFQFDYFEWNDTTTAENIFTGTLFFGDEDTQYRLNMILNADKVEEGDINEFAIQMTGYRRSDGEVLGSLDKSATLDQLVPNLVIELVSEFKTENLDDEGNRIIKNELPGPPNDTEDDTTNDTESEPATDTEEQPAEEPTGEVQDTNPDEEEQPQQ